MSVHTIYDEPSDGARQSQLVLYAYDGPYAGGTIGPYLLLQAMERSHRGTNDEFNEVAEVVLSRTQAISLMHALDRWLRS